MATRESKMGLGLVIFTMLFVVSSAQSNCVPAISGLTSCFGYFIGISSSPTSACCNQISNLIDSQAPCYCTIFMAGVTSSLGFIVNQTQAISLPSICNLNPLTQCDTLSTPSPLAAPPPAPMTPSVPSVTPPSTSPLPSGTGQKATPAQSSATKSCTTFAPALLFFLLFLAS